MKVIIAGSRSGTMHMIQSMERNGKSVFVYRASRTPLPPYTVPTGL